MDNYGCYSEPLFDILWINFFFLFDQALFQTMLHSKTHPYEGLLAAKFEYECKMRGAQRMA